MQNFVPAVSLTLPLLQAVKVEAKLRLVCCEMASHDSGDGTKSRIKKLSSAGRPGPGGLAKVETMRVGNKVGKRTASNAYCGVE